jgi:endonuclease/exonuclease/phosphatase family metal-dependent hydrolase
MNLCLSGDASCYHRNNHLATVEEAAGQIAQQAAQAVTVNEVCSRDATNVARRTGYDVRFAAVLVSHKRLRCANPGGRGVFGIAILTKDSVRASHDEAFTTYDGQEERRWLCVQTVTTVTVCTAHLGTRGSAEGRRANDAQCAELGAVLTRYGEGGTTVFGGDVNRRKSCAPTTMWVRRDSSARQQPGIQHIYGSPSIHVVATRAAVATYTDHDYFSATGRLR